MLSFTEIGKQIKLTIFGSNYKEFIPEALIAATQILLNDVNLEKDILNLVEKNFNILYCKIPSIKDPIDRNLFLEMKEETTDSNEIIISYRSVSIEDMYQPLFSSDTPCPKPYWKSIITPLGSHIYRNKSLMQIALAEGNTRLATQLLNCFPKDKRVDGQKQFIEQFPIDWQVKEIAWLAPYKKAIIKFSDTITTLFESNKEEENDFFITALNDAIKELRIAFAKASSREVKMGFRLPLEMMLFVLEHVKSKIDAKIWSSSYVNPPRDTFLINVYGLLQKLAVAHDASLDKNILFRKLCNDLGGMYFMDNGIPVARFLPGRLAIMINFYRDACGKRNQEIEKLTAELNSEKIPTSSSYFGVSLSN